MPRSQSTRILRQPKDDIPAFLLVERNIYEMIFGRDTWPETNPYVTPDDYGTMLKQRMPLRLHCIVLLSAGWPLGRRMKYKEIAQLLGISKSRVGQLHNKAIQRLRSGMRKREIEEVVEPKWSICPIRGYIP